MLILLQLFQILSYLHSLLQECFFVLFFPIFLLLTLLLTSLDLF